MQDAALPWIVVQQTGSAMAVGFLLFCRYLPFALFGLPSGAIADRFDNRRVLLITQTVSMAIAALLAALSLGGALPLWAIYVLASAGGCAAVLDAPSRQSLTFQLVGPEELPNAVALNSGLLNAARIVGPATAGVIIAFSGVGVCFALNAVSFMAVLLGLCVMRPGDSFPRETLSGHAPIRDGIRYVAARSELRYAIIAAGVVAIAGYNFRVLVPVLAAKTLKVGSTLFGLLYACLGCGAVAGALASAASPPRAWKRLPLGLGLASSALLCVAPIRSVPVIAVLLFLVGLGFTVWQAATQSLLQLSSPGSLRGRVLSVYLLVFAGLTPVGSVLAGWLIELRGTEFAFGVAGSVGLVAAAIGLVVSKRQEPAVSGTGG